MGFAIRSDIVLVTGCMCLTAQRNTQITGRTTDQSDAVVPEARVTLGQ